MEFVRNEKMVEYGSKMIVKCCTKKFKNFFQKYLTSRKKYVIVKRGSLKSEKKRNWKNMVFSFFYIIYIRATDCIKKNTKEICENRLTR